MPAPPLASQNVNGRPFDTASRSKDILAHLNSVIQFYRASIDPGIQKAGEPNDVIYRDQAKTLAGEVAGFAFESSSAEAALLAQYQLHQTSPSGDTPSEQAKMQGIESNVEHQIDGLLARKADLEKRLATAKSKDRAALQSARDQTQGSLDLSNSMKDALQKIVDMTGAAPDAGLAGDIERLKISVPELNSKNKTAAAPVTSIEAARSAGVTSQGMVLIDLLETKHDLETLLHSNDALHKQALILRTPVTTVLRSLIAQGQLLSQPAAQQGNPTSGISTPGAPVNRAVDGAPAVAAAPNYKLITKQFKALSGAAVPLSQEIIALEQSRANLKAWQTAVTREYKSVLHALLLRMLVIAIALALILGGGEVWTRVTHQYVRDIRRRRQFLLIRRTVVTFLCVIVLLFGFVTQFNSLATFAGFITAGIAVGLQTILLSVAAYFFIIGRYGVKVGDRITIASVTGDVIDVGLVRFYMMELAGSGTELNPTGRVAVFSNAVLFQAGTPLYKQIPGTEYAWHELIVKLVDGANYPLVCEAVMKEVHLIFDGYKAQIERQHRGVESQMQTSIGPPVIESRLQSNGGAWQLWARFPVQFIDAAETDEKLTRSLADLIARNPEIKAAVAAVPIIQASIRG